MSLRERLEAARAERRRRAGLPPEPPAVSPMSQPIDLDADRSSDPATIDLTGVAPVVDLRPELAGRDRTPAFSGALEIGQSDRCPHCGGPGRLDMQDYVGRVDHYSCTDCGLLFQVAR